MDTFWSRKGSLGTSKISVFCKTSYRFCDFGLLSSSRLRDPILDPPGLRFGSFGAPKIAETSLEIPLGALKGRSKDLFSRPGGLQERFRRALGAEVARRSLRGRFLETFWLPKRCFLWLFFELPWHGVFRLHLDSFLFDFLSV